MHSCTQTASESTFKHRRNTESGYLKFKNNNMNEKTHTVKLMVKGQILKLTFDEQTIKLFTKYRWYPSKVASRRSKPYMHLRRFIRTNGKRESVSFHREAVGLTERGDGKKRHLCVDHINGDTLDNRMCNLRVCTYQENSLNQDTTRKRKAQGLHKGVYKEGNKYAVRITIDRKVQYKGSFQTEQEAIDYYKELSLKHHGAFSVFNRPEVKQ